MASKQLLIYCPTQTSPTTVTNNSGKTIINDGFMYDENKNPLIVNNVNSVNGIKAAPGSYRFNDSTNIHFTLLQTTQSGKKYVKPIWWGGMILGDVYLKNGNSTIGTFPIKKKMCDTNVNPGSNVYVDSSIVSSVDILEQSVTLNIDPQIQSFDCDKTTSLDKNIVAFYAYNNTIDGSYVTLINLDRPFGCDVQLWAVDENENEIQGSRKTLEKNNTSINLYFNSKASGIRFKLDGLENNKKGPYNINVNFRDTIDDIYREILYAYKDNKLWLYSRDQKYETKIINGNGDVLFTGKCFKKVEKIDTNNSIDGIKAEYGKYKLIDISNIDIISKRDYDNINSSYSYILSNYCLSDIEITYTYGTPNKQILEFDESNPKKSFKRENTSNYTVSLVNNPVQTINKSTIPTNIIVSTEAKLENDGWYVRSYIVNSNNRQDSSIDGSIYVTFENGEYITIPKKSTNSGYKKINSQNVIWTTPETGIDSNYEYSDSITIRTSPVIDVTSSHWNVMPRAQGVDSSGNPNGYYAYDLEYTNGRIPTSNELKYTTKTGRNIYDSSLYYLHVDNGYNNYIKNDNNMSISLIRGGTEDHEQPRINLCWGLNINNGHTNAHGSDIYHDKSFYVEPNIKRDYLKLYYINNGHLYLQNYNPHDHNNAMRTALYELIEKIGVSYRGTITYPKSSMSTFYTFKTPDSTLSNDLGVIQTVDTTGYNIVFDETDHPYKYIYYSDTFNYVQIYNIHNGHEQLIDW